MKTVTYSTIKNLAAHLAGRSDDTVAAGARLTTSEAIALLAFFHEELRVIWNAEAWPWLCDNLEAVTLDASNAFSKREGAGDEMGDILAVIVGGNPTVTTQVRVLPKDRVVELDGRVILPGNLSGAIWVDWQDPAPSLLSVASASLDAYTIPADFKEALAYRGAAFLLAQEDPALANQYRGLAQRNLDWHASRLVRPWWRATIAPPGVRED